MPTHKPALVSIADDLAGLARAYAPAIALAAFIGGYFLRLAVEVSKCG